MFQGNQRQQQHAMSKGNNSWQCQDCKRKFGSFRVHNLGYLASELVCDSSANDLGDMVIQEGRHVTLWFSILMNAGTSMMLLRSLCCGCSRTCF